MRHAVSKRRGKGRWELIRKNAILYLFLLPTIVYFVVFRVLPIINMRLAFYNYKARGPWLLQDSNTSR